MKLLKLTPQKPLTHADTSDTSDTTDTSDTLTPGEGGSYGAGGDFGAGADAEGGRERLSATTFVAPGVWRSLENSEI